MTFVGETCSHMIGPMHSQGNSASEWDDVVFVPPGLKLSSDLTQETPTATK